MDELRQYIEDRYTAGEFIERLGLSIEEVCEALYNDFEERIMDVFNNELSFDGDLSDGI